MGTPDRLDSLLTRFRIETSLFHTGPLCGVTTFAPLPGRGFLHILRRGEMDVSCSGSVARVHLDQPTLLFYPRPVRHAFHNAPVEGSDFTCAALDFDGGQTHPLVRTLPSVVMIPMREVQALEPALEMLFSEVDSVRCGQRLVANRLFEVVLIQLLRWMLDHVDDLGLPKGLFAGLADPDLTSVLVGIHEEPGANWSLDAMARAAGMSRSAFAARFREVLTVTPGEYLTNWRLTVAQQRLQQGAAVSQVAHELGYRTASSFSRVFTQHLGTSPRGWLLARRVGTKTRRAGTDSAVASSAGSNAARTNDAGVTPYAERRQREVGAAGGSAGPNGQDGSGAAASSTA